MSGSKTNLMTPEQIKKAVKKISPNEDFRWDGKNEEDRPATEQEVKSALKNSTKKRGRPRKPSPKVHVTLRLSHEVIDYFRAGGRGWQTRMDEALKEWIQAHGKH